MKEVKITQDRKGQLIQNILKILNENPHGLHHQKILNILEKRVGITEYESGSYENDPKGKRFEKIVLFSTIGPSKAGWIKKTKGIWQISEDGKSALETLEKPKDFIIESGRLYKEWHDETKLLENDNNTFGQPFSNTFSDPSEAKQVMDLFRKTILWLQDDEQERQSQLVLSVGKNGRMTINFGQWAVLSYCFQNRWAVALKTYTMKTLLGKECTSFADKIDGVEYTALRITDSDFHPDQIMDEFEETVRIIGEKFRLWKGTPFNKAHQPKVYEAIMFPEKRAKLLTEGISQKVQTLGGQIPYWVIAPGEGAQLWNDYLKKGLISIGWAKSGDLSLLTSKKAIRDELEKKDPEQSSSQSAKMLHDFAHVMQPGDYVFAKSGRKSVLGWGVIKSDYNYKEGENLHPHTREVEWKNMETFEMPNGQSLPLKTLTRYDKNDELTELLTGFYLDDKATNVSEFIPYTREQALKDLFIDEDKFDRIISTLRRKKNIVLQGAPGTGKTYIAKRLAYSLMGEENPNRVAMIQFHQSSNYEDFIQGFRPDNDGNFRLRNGIFYEFCELAKGSPEVDFVFIIDEINRGNLSKIFGELMMLIEPDKRDKRYAMTLTYTSGDEDKFHVPENLHLIGTMNTADKSLSLVDYALRRRFAFLEMDPGFQSKVFAEVLAKAEISQKMIEKIRSTMRDLNKKIEEDAMNLGRGFRIGHSFFVPGTKVEDEEKWFREIIEFEVAPLLEEYWMDDPSGLTSANSIIGINE